MPKRQPRSSRAQRPGPAGFKKFFQSLATSFPDAKVSVGHLVPDDDNVAIAYTLIGTHNGEFIGVPPIGKAFTVRGMQITRFDGGEHPPFQVAPPVSEWDSKTLAVDGFHHAVYALATGVASSLLDRGHQ